MAKSFHEVRDPIHDFVRFDSTEREVIDSRPLQRLRHIHQLGMSHLVYPGATHKRFEHSLGVMELAGRVFDVLTHWRNTSDWVLDVFPKIDDRLWIGYWRMVLRIAALCHDIGHLPFSHVAEKELLPKGWSHERLTMQLIRSDAMSSMWSKMRPPLETEDIVKLAVGPKFYRKDPRERAAFSDWEALLSEIIVGDAFGVDRMDYLLRDSHHAGVVYGKFGHIRLIDTLRVLPPPGEDSREPRLGVEQGGLHSAEALLLARYFMYAQVYFHRVRRIYDIHLRDFLKEWLPRGTFDTDLEAHLNVTDAELTVALLEAARDHSKPGHDAARRIVERDHFRLLWQRNPKDWDINKEAGPVLSRAVMKEFGPEAVRYDYVPVKGGLPDFPVKCKDGRIVSSLRLSQTLRTIPSALVDYIFVDPDKRDKAEAWMNKNRETILKKAKKGEIQQ
ncbi:HD domain-containing protein [bacterium]|nr:HD domain-containing protein [bacterium]